MTDKTKKHSAILINQENKEKIQKFLDEQHTGRERSRTIDLGDVFTALGIAESRSDKLTMKQKRGLMFHYSLNSKKPSSYKFSYQADTITLAWKKDGWVLAKLERKDFWPSEKDKTFFYFDLPDEEKVIRFKEVSNRLLDAFLMQ
jgi:hypothetical protein